MQSGKTLRDEVERKLRLHQLHGMKDETTKVLDKLRPILADFQEQNVELMDFLQGIVDAINRLFWIREVTIGLRDPDGKYRYKVMSGFRPTSWALHKQLTYTWEEFSDPKLYKSSQISRHTRVFLAEDKPYTEEEVDSYTRPILLKAERTSVDDCIEGDYFDTYVYGKSEELIGWIEITGTKDGRFPDPTIIRWIEMLALIVGMAITGENPRERNRLV